MGNEPTQAETDRIALANLVLTLRRRGVRDRRIYAAIENIPRRMFLSIENKAHAWDDRPLPIECGQTISAPSMVAMMTEALEVGPGDRVLEIGTGSGYQTSVLSRLCREVYTIERYRSLTALAEERFAVLRFSNIVTRVDDGINGWPEKAPFDRILVTASAQAAPRALVEQLKVGGIMVMPLGPAAGPQQLMKVVRTQRGADLTAVGPVRFVPLVPGVANRL